VARLFEAAQRTGNTQKLESGIIDGKSIHRPGPGSMPPSVGELASRMGRTSRTRDGIFEFFYSSEGDIVRTPARIRLFERLDSGRGRQEKANWRRRRFYAVNWAIALGNRDFRLSLGFAVAMARRITRPIAEMRDKATMVLSGGEILVRTGSAELGAVGRR